MSCLLTAVTFSALAGCGGAQLPTPADTARPAIPSAFVPPTDTSKLLRSQGDIATVYFRDLLEIRFADTTRGVRVRAVLWKYRGEIVGGHVSQRTYFVRFPDPGTRASYDSVRLAVALEPGVDYVLPVILRANPNAIRPDGQYPMPHDTARPAVPSRFDRPPDSSRLVRSRVDTATLYYRDILEILFDTGASGPVVRSVLSRYGATIIGGRPLRGTYVVQLPDPGSDDAWMALRVALSREPVVTYVLPVFFRAGPNIIRIGGASPASQDTSPPPIPPEMAFDLDSRSVIRVPGDTSDVRYRNVFLVRFDRSVSGLAIRGFIRRYAASIIGGMPFVRAYQVRTPDPGVSWPAFDSLRIPDAVGARRHPGLPARTPASWPRARRIARVTGPAPRLGTPFAPSLA